MCEATLAACRDVGMTDRGVVLVDERVDPYPGLEDAAPKNWRVVRTDKNMGDLWRWVFETYPREDYYGWLPDDCLPRTSGFDRIMGAATEGWYVVDCQDAHLGRSSEMATYSLCGAFCWGGNLLRTVGYWAPPGFQHQWVDAAWIHLTMRVADPPLRKFLGNVLVEHHPAWRAMHLAEHSRSGDETDAHNQTFVEADEATFNAWRDSGEPEAAYRRIQAAMTSAGCRA